MVCAIVLSLAVSRCGYRSAHPLKQPVCQIGTQLANQLVYQVQRSSDDPVRAALAVEISPLLRGQISFYTRRLQEEALAVRETPPRGAADVAIMAALNEHFFGPAGFAASSDLSGPGGDSVAAVLESRRGTCVGLAIVYLALAQRLGLEAHAVATPVHVFIRVHLGNTVHNVELTESGREIEDDTYRRRYRIDEASISAGVFMRGLSNAEVIAHLLSNQAVALGKQRRLDDALARYDAALTLAPQLVAAWYNRGLDLMSAGRLQEALADFSRAIELYPSDAQAHNNRGLAKMRFGNREGARADFTRALELQPGMREAQENLKRLVASDQ
jgi:regulator of sirC expression with transglutaminase-like and TPR domain